MKQIAILGYGIVGSGVDEVIREYAEKKRSGVTLSVKYILDIRDIPDSRVVSDFALIEEDPDVAVVVESIGGRGAAAEFTRRALSAGKHVVTSNKELVAEHGAELLALAKANNAHYLFEASVGGGIPIIHPFCQCLGANTVTDVIGILNGTSNYILTHMEQNGASFEEALKEAQKLGYAEADPSADVDGLDCARKICILADLAYGRHIPPSNIYVEGIGSVTTAHLREANKAGFTIKLLGRAHQAEGELPRVYAAPHMVAKAHPLAAVSDVFNAVMLRGSVAGDVMFYGRGAGARPTASAVVSDILDCLRSDDPLCGFAWSADPLDIAPPQNAPGYIFADGKKMRVLKNN
ncbi:MAG: homoserine dehydrogenase [Oscillospiraceae bacterium]|jgi:homoserine dehydrogenase|nr:homoserine dehydrogenase [Oscillospiraceae bacterium]